MTKGKVGSVNRFLYISETIFGAISSAAETKR
jgi:hypothetical protein